MKDESGIESGDKFNATGFRHAWADLCADDTIPKQLKQTLFSKMGHRPETSRAIYQTIDADKSIRVTVLCQKKLEMYGDNVDGNVAGTHVPSNANTSDRLTDMPDLESNTSDENMLAIRKKIFHRRVANALTEQRKLHVP